MRLFVGVALPSEARSKLSVLECGLPGARWVQPENLHLTLRFIGEVDSGQAEDLDLALSAIDSPAFEMKLRGIDFFGSERKLRSIWAGVEKCEALVHLHEKVESAVVRSGFEPEGRKFKPHITLARFKNGKPSLAGQFIEANNGFGVEPFPIAEFTLFRSHIGHAGASYEVLARYPLNGGEAGQT